MIGVYPVTIKASICVPNDYTKISCTTWNVQYEFEIRMEPCKISSFTGSPIAGNMFYTVQ